MTKNCLRLLRYFFGHICPLFGYFDQNFGIFCTFYCLKKYKANDFEKVKELVEKHDADTTHQEEETGARFSKYQKYSFYHF